jgi:hypothetical protein
MTFRRTHARTEGGGGNRLGKKKNWEVKPEENKR